VLLLLVKGPYRTGPGIVHPCDEVPNLLAVPRHKETHFSTSSLVQRERERERALLHSFFHFLIFYQFGKPKQYTAAYLAVSQCRLMCLLWRWITVVWPVVIRAELKEVYFLSGPTRRSHMPSQQNNQGNMALLLLCNHDVTLKVWNKLPKTIVNLILVPSKYPSKHL